MDSWQKAMYKKLKDFVGYGEISEPDGKESVKMSITQKEAYVLMKSLEDQQRYLSPTLLVQPKEIEND